MAHQSNPTTDDIEVPIPLPRLVSSEKQVPHSPYTVQCHVECRMSRFAFLQLSEFPGYMMPTGSQILYQAILDRAIHPDRKAYFPQL